MKFESKPLKPSYAVLSKYRRRLGGLCKRMIEESYKAISAAYANEKPDFSFDGFGDIESLIENLRKQWLAVFQSEGARMCSEMLEEMLAHNLGQVAQVFKDFEMPLAGDRQTRVKSLNFAPRPKEEEGEGGSGFVSFATPAYLLASSRAKVLESARASLAENKALMNSTVNNFFDSAMGIAARGSQSDSGVREFKRQLRELGQRTFRRVNDFTEDQAYKASSAFSARILFENGIRKFKWVHTYTGKRPRLWHKYELNGKVFEYDNPPVIDPKTGVRGLPGQLAYCRCEAVAVNE